jgi:thiosulfate dehydrogenase (quinone) large subunit
MTGEIMSVRTVKTQSGRIIQDLPLARLLFSDTRFAIVWFFVRVWVGLQWFEAATHKISDPAWMQTGEALQGYWTRAVAIPETGRPAITFDWYRGFLQGMLDSGAYTWFAKVIALGELFIGIALIIGAFVGIAAFFGAFMNWNFVMAGSASSNGLLLVLAIFLVLAWKVAGYYGADFFLLRRLGTPWGQGTTTTAVEESQRRSPSAA